MFADPPDITQVGFGGLLDRVLALISDDPPYLGGTIPCPTRPGDLHEQMQPSTRISVQVEGLQRYAVSVVGERRDIELSRGQCLFLAPNAWSIEFNDTVGETFGIVLMPHTMRLIQIRFADRGPPIWRTPWAYHTDLPLGGAALLVCRALGRLAEEGKPHDGAGELLLGVLRLARRHLLDDTPSKSDHTRAQRTWRTAREYLTENFGKSITRESVAKALDLHPNYLSALARQVAGQAFHEVLEGIRIEHVQRLLRETDLKVSRIARLCGYANTRSLAKAFHRLTGVTPSGFRKPEEVPRKAL